MKLIFLSSIPFIEGDHFKYGFEYYNKNNIKIEICYLNKVFSRNYKVPSKNFSKKIKVIYLETIKEFDEYIKSNKDAVFFLRYTYNFNNRKIFNLLSKNSAKYIYSQGVLRHDSFGYLNLPLKRILIIKLKQLLKGKIFNIFNSIINKLFLLINKKYFGIKNAEYILLKGEYGEKIKKHRLYGSKTKIINAHHRDYDKFLFFKKKKIKSNIKKAIFIDQGVPFHPDQKEIGIINIDEKRYYNSIKNFLTKLRDLNGYKIEISCHPRININLIKKYFKNFTIKKYQTINQIYNSDLVLTHESNAINFAILFKKKILFITNNELCKQPYAFKESFEFLSRRLKKKCYNIDNFNIKKLKLITKVNQKAYANFVKRYIKFKGLNEHHANIISKKLKKYDY